MKRPSEPVKKPGGGGTVSDKMEGGAGIVDAPTKGAKKKPVEKK